MNREEFLKMRLRTGRIVQRVVRAKHDFSDGVMQSESHAEFIRNGIIHSIDVLDLAVLPCGHRARPAMECRQGTSEGVEPHFVCAECTSKCFGCAANICAHHAAVIEDLPYCPDCAGQLAWDGILQSCTGALGRLLA